MMTIEESGMSFLTDGNKTFLIEKNSFVGQLSGMSCCEFVEAHNNATLVLVEAKTSFSNPNNKSGFHTNIEEIAAKFHDSIEILNALCIRHKGIITGGIEKVNLRNVNYVFYLVIKNHEKSWLPPVSDALKSKMKVLFKLWNIKDVSLKVLNEDLARKKGLIK